MTKIFLSSWFYGPKYSVKFAKYMQKFLWPPKISYVPCLILTLGNPISNLQHH
jgi:hypothetical protein